MVYAVVSDKRTFKFTHSFRFCPTFTRYKEVRSWPVLEASLNSGERSPAVARGRQAASELAEGFVAPAINSQDVRQCATERHARGPNTASLPSLSLSLSKPKIDG